MSKYKVIYRDDNLSWQELCPVRMLAIQVARDTETGTCFLQTKLVNVTSQTISRIEFTIDLTGEDGKTESVDFALLDADLPGGEILRPQAKKIELSVIAGAKATVTRADNQCDFGTAIEIDSPKPLALNEDEESERIVLLLEMEAQPDKCANAHTDHDGWWQCGCGAVNIARKDCWDCGAKHEKLTDLESASFLEESRKDRLYRTSKEMLESLSVSLLQQAKENFEELAELGYKDSAERVIEAEQCIATSHEKKKKRLKCAAIVGAIVAVGLIAFSLFGLTQTKTKQAEIRNAQIGQTVELGTYSDELPAYKGTSVEGKPIKWIVVHKDGDRALLMTEQIIDSKAVDEDGDVSDFAYSSLYKYLNADFKNHAFSSAERALLKDDVSLPSTTELDTYVSDDDILEATPIDTVSESKWWTSTIEEYEDDDWDWLWDDEDDWDYSDSDDSEFLSSYVDSYGDIVDDDGDYAQYEALGVRPAIWVKLN